MSLLRDEVAQFNCQPQDQNFPWHRIFDYKDELNNHFEDINDRIRMVNNGEMN